MRKKQRSTLLLALALCLGLSFPGATVKASEFLQGDSGAFFEVETRQNPAMELRGVWVATVFGLDYPAAPTDNPEELKTQARAILDSCVELGMNAVFLQVRPTCDALYPSKLFPWSSYLTGSQGKAPKGGFDPLLFWVEEAHARGIALHAWINPYRITKEGKSQWDRLSKEHPGVKNPQWVVEHQGNYYFDPGLPQVRELVLQGAQELVERYAIDGIHLDDYFYPGSDFEDQATYEAYGKGFASLGDWRRHNVNLLISQLHQRLEAIDPALSFGVSPSGVWADESSLPEGSATGGKYESYFDAYADSRRWVLEGWVDYICPQIYWAVGQKNMDYQVIAAWWNELVKGKGVSLYIGMGDYLAAQTEPGSPWEGTAQLERQLSINRALPQVTGEVHFRHRLMEENSSIRQLYQREYGAPREKPYLNRVTHTPYLLGDASATLRPNHTLTRGEAVQLLARQTVNEQGEPLYTGSPYLGGFSDVSPHSWYAPAVQFARDYGIAGGYPDGTFRPEAPVTRGELVTLTARFFPAGTAASPSFSDVPPSHWAAKAIALAQEQGWVGGYGDGSFRPDAFITRGEAVKLLNGAMDRQPDQEAIGLVSNPFPDLTPGHWAYAHLLEAALPHGFRKENGREIWL